MTSIDQSGRTSTYSTSYDRPSIHDAEVGSMVGRRGNAPTECEASNLKDGTLQSERINPRPIRAEFDVCSPRKAGECKTQNLKSTDLCVKPGSLQSLCKLYLRNLC